jgi:hypothetical protein
MEKIAGLRSTPDVVRRTAPLKVLIGLLYRELDAAKSSDSVTVNRELFESVITTLECVVEDVELRAGGKAEARALSSEPAARVAAARP